MLGVLFIIFGFFTNEKKLIYLNYVVPFLVVWPYLFSFDIRIIFISFLVFLILKKIIPEKKILFESSSNIFEITIVLLWTISIFYVIEFRHYQPNLNPFVSHLLIIKWYIFWITLKTHKTYGKIVTIFLLISLFLYSSRTDLILLLYLLYFKNRKFYNNYISKYYKFFPLAIVFIVLVSVYTATRNYSQNWNVDLIESINQIDTEIAIDYVQVYLIERLLDSSQNTSFLLDRPPNYLATFENLPQIFIPRFLWPNKGYFLPGIYYNSLLTNEFVSNNSKNLEVGFIAIWWHNFGYFFIMYFLLVVFFLVFFIKDKNPVFVLFIGPKLFSDYNAIPGLIEAVIIYLIISKIYVSYYNNRQRAFFR